MQVELQSQDNLSIRAGAVEDLLFGPDGNVSGVCLLDGAEIGCGRVILTTGTFLRGEIHIGEERYPAGRVGEAPCLGLSKTHG